MNQEEREAQGEGDRFEVPIAIAIALITVIGAIVAWRASMVEGNASESSHQGLIETIKREAAAATDLRYLYQEADYTLQYIVARTHIGALQTQAEAMRAQGNEDEATAMEMQATWESETAKALEGFSPMTTEQGYQKADGSLDLDRRLKEIRSENQDLASLDPSTAFREADRAYLESELLVGSIIGLTASVFFLSMAEVIRRRLRYLFIAMGIGVFALAMLSILGIEAYFIISSLGG
ncbi:MAG TPA: hypothetical protein EYP49_15075 [Anaerolineae bacterium]|nr:hypothetical protein [Anaerolineae bacterium]